MIGGCGPVQLRYAKAGDTNLAYQVFGDGPATIVAVPPMAQNVELAWEWPAVRRMFERFASFSRYLHFGKRGTGASDRSLPIPDVDQRVDDLRAVMDAAGIERAHLFGVSEGGPMTLLFAASYPERVEGIILDSSGARLVDRDDPAGPDPARIELVHQFADAWGTPDSMTVDLFAPSMAGDLEFRAWHERYERQAASRESILTLLLMNGAMDAREVLPLIDVPVLIVHRVDDVVAPIRFARETASGLADVRMVELPGADHFTYAADMDTVLDEIERFVTGHVARSRAPLALRHAVEITTLGRFAVTVDGAEVETSQWGSRRARQLLKRLVAARGWPVTRDELADLLWPDEADHERLRPRLSVQLSAVRRVLHGGIIADRSSVRLDLEHVALDVVRFDSLERDDELVAAYSGEFLPDDRYDDWVETVRTELRARFVAAAHRLIEEGEERGDPSLSATIAARVLVVEPYDEAAHRSLVVAHHAQGSPAAADAAHGVYCQRMN